MEKLNYIFSVYKSYLLVLSGVGVIVLFLLWSGLINLSSPSPSLPNASQNNSSVSFIKPVVNKDVKNLHWVNNETLAYTYFHPAERRLVLAQYSNNTETILLNKSELKLSELYWSSKNDVLIFDYGVPYKTYLFTRQGQLRQLPLEGYAFSWSPNSDQIFYLNSLAQDTPQLYQISSGRQIALSRNILPFQFSYWPKSGNKIITYLVDIETGSGKLAAFSLEDPTANEELAPNARFPTLSPNGFYTAFSNGNTVSVISLTDKQTSVAYKSKYNEDFISFGWLSNSQLLVVDTNERIPIFIVFNIDGTYERFGQALPLQSKQRVNIAVSPNTKRVAIASEKDGLFLLEL